MATPTKRSTTLQTYLEPSELAHINISKLKESELKCWIALVYSARNKANQKFHTVSMDDLIKISGYSGKNKPEFVATLKKLTTKSVEFNLLRKNKKEIGGIVCSLVASVDFDKKDGYVEFEFSEKLQSILSNSTMFSRLSLAIVRNIQTKAALGLYRLCNDYRKIGTTPQIELNALKKILGSEGSYKDFKLFNQKVIGPALQRCKEQTDLTIKAHLVRTNRKVSHVKFTFIETSLPLNLGLSKPLVAQTKSETTKAKPTLAQLSNAEVLAQQERIVQAPTITNAEHKLLQKLNQAIRERNIY